MLIPAFIPPKLYCQIHDEKHYCEAIIDNYGRIRDAIPSHQECLIRLYCEKHNITREELFSNWHPEASPLHWIAESLNYTVVWYSNLLLPYRYTSRQIATLRLLIGNHVIDPCKKYISVATEKSLMDYRYSGQFDKIDELIENKAKKREEIISKLWKKKEQSNSLTTSSTS